MHGQVFWVAVNFSFTLVFFYFILFIEVLMKELAGIMIHLCDIFNCRVSFKILLPICLLRRYADMLGENFEHSSNQANFRMKLSKKLTEHSRMSFSSRWPSLSIILNKINKIKKLNKGNTMTSSYRPKFRPTQSTGVLFFSFLFFLVWGKIKFFLIILSWQT